MPFFKLAEMQGSVISPDHSSANGPTITGEQLEMGYYTEPKGSGAHAHHHPSEQIILVLAGRLRMTIAGETRDVGPGEVALIPGGVVHEQKALEDGTRFVSCKRSTGTELTGA